MNRDFIKLNQTSRRAFLSRAAQTLLGVTVVPALNSLAAAAPSGAKAKHVIYLFMNGGMSHIDTLDPKPGTEEQGPTGAIQTSMPGIQLSEHLPNLAKQLQDVAVIRSMSTETGAHGPASYLMRTGYPQIASIRHPSLGAWVQKIDGKLNPDLPGNVVVGAANQHPLAGFLDANHAAVPISNPAAGLENTRPPGYLKQSQFDRRMTLAKQFDRSFQSKFRHRDVKAYTKLYDEAVSLLSSKDLEAFDISKEPQQVRDNYGSSQVGQGCLLARRLVENRVRFIEVSFGGWDDHSDIFANLPARVQQLDQALTALLSDLKEKELLDKTLVVLTSEFGRGVTVNENSGRDHHPGAFSTLLAGGGVKGGAVWGATDEIAFSVDEDHVTVQDFNATIAYALGLPLDEEIFSPGGRPFTIARGGTPLAGLF